MANNAKLPDLNTLLQAGIDPRTGLPLRMESGDQAQLKTNIKKVLRIIDETNAIKRFKWENLPSGLDGDLLERILYYRGQACFFYIPTNDTYYFLPYALSGNIDVYGRFMNVTPLPFNGQALDKNKDVKPFIVGLTREPLYQKASEIKDIDPEGAKSAKCVLLRDYVQQISETIIPRQMLQDPILDVESDCIPFMHTALLSSTGISAVRVNSEDEQSNVEAASRSINSAALSGRKYIAVIGNLEFQELTAGQTAKAEEFMMAMESIDKFRLSAYGLTDSGVFEKQGTMLQSEQSQNAASNNQVLQYSLENRQKFCDIVNDLFGLNISVSEVKQPEPEEADGANPDDSQFIEEGGTDE